MVTQIERMLVEAWEKFCAYYDTEATKYTQIEYNRLCNECNYKEEKAKKELEKNHWICWDEYDLTFHIGRFFYDILSKKKEEEFSNIEIHFDKKVDRKNIKKKSTKSRHDSC